MQGLDIVSMKHKNAWADAPVPDRLGSRLADHGIYSIAANNSRGSARSAKRVMDM